MKSRATLPLAPPSRVELAGRCWFLRDLLVAAVPWLPPYFLEPLRLNPRIDVVVVVPGEI